VAGWLQRVRLQYYGLSSLVSRDML